MCNNHFVKINLKEYLCEVDDDPLNEETYKDFMKEINPSNLPHRDYSPLIPYVKFVGVKDNIIKFFVPNKYNGWNTYIQFDDWDEILHDETVNANYAGQLLLQAGNIRVFCPCPAFKFWGMQYILTQREASIIPEMRYPSVKNPYLKGVVCKHLNRNLKVLGFHSQNIAASIKGQRQKLGIK